jgi:hypothetical protein
MTADRNAGIFASSTETPPRSPSRFFTYRKMKIAASPFVYRGATIFVPKKLGNLQALNQPCQPCTEARGLGFVIMHGSVFKQRT